jgi:DNA (cytosine-5)-methyltransferase 1
VHNPPSTERADERAASYGRGVKLSEHVMRSELLPTPTTDPMSGNGHARHLGQEVLLPTPTARDSEGSGGSKPYHVTLTDATVRTDMGKQPNPRHEQLLPTPRATRGGSTTETAYAFGGERSDDDRTQGQVLLPTPRATDGVKGGPNQRGSSGDLMLPSAVTLLPTPSVADVEGGRKSRSGDRSDELLLNGIAAEQQWGKYADAIERWSRVIDQTAPPPTEPNAKGNHRLSPRFVEWMMGLPAGRVTDVPNVSRNDALKLCGNGVVPQQAATAVAYLLPIILRILHRKAAA